MSKNTITSLFFALFTIIFSFFFGGEYFDFYEEKSQNNQANAQILSELASFSLQDIRTLENTEFYYTPYKSLINKIVEKIDNAQEKIYIEVYIFTEKSIQQAVINAKKRGVDVKIIMEKNPYLAYNINNKAAEKFENNNINYVWSDSQDYTFNHSKFLIIDDLSIISTGNISYSTFTKNRDLFLFSKDALLTKKLNEIFSHDFVGDKYNTYSSNLILSPFYSRKKFETLFNQSNQSIDMYFQYFKDEELINHLIIAAQKGIQVKAIISKSALESNIIEIDKMKNAGIDIQYLSKNKMHSKAILVDKKYLFIGSINFSEYSLDRNREVGVLLDNPEIINKFIQLFSSENTTNTNID